MANLKVIFFRKISSLPNYYFLIQLFFLLVEFSHPHLDSSGVEMLTCRIADIRKSSTMIY